MSQLTTGLLSTLALVAVGLAAPVDNARIVGRDVALASSYDYIVVGGGTSGLVVADRLSEDKKKTVLVIESGHLDDQEDGVLIPGLAGSTGKKYMFNITCEPQPGMNGRTYSLLAAKVVGGGTVVNGMAFDRGSAGDYDLWEDMGNPGWGWDGLLPYFKKSETYTHSPPDIVSAYGTKFDSSAHGYTGPVHSSMPAFIFPAVKLMFKAWQQLGISTPDDGANGQAIGAFWIPGSVDPRSSTRSYARTAYYDPNQSRSNFHLLTGKTVTKLVLKGKKVTGVTFAASPTDRVTTVSAGKEVILAAGSGHTPQILQLSGIGPKALLQKLGIPVVNDLPGVGRNFQDHPIYYFSGAFTNDVNPSPANMSNPIFAAEMMALYKATGEGPYANGRGSGAAFLKLSDVAVQPQYRNIINKIRSQDPAAYLPAGTDRTIVDGYKTQRELLIAYIESGRVAVQESAFGSAPSLGVALQKPFSRGVININSTDPFANPVVDYRVLSNPVDLDIFVEMIKTNRKLFTMPALVGLVPLLDNPPPSAKSDDEIKAAIMANIVPTFAHPSSTCSMLKLEHGGVVDSSLRVYGISNLSIVDGSIIPMTPATHLSSTIYAVAEKAADLIKARA